MAVSVTMPRLGESVTEGTVTRWLKKEGESVQADEPLLEVSTDKVDTEIPAPASGVLTSIKVSEDETVEVGAELAVIDGDGGSGDSGGSGAGAAGGEAPAADATAAEPAAAGSGEPAEAAAETTEPAASERAAADPGGAAAAATQQAQPDAAEEPAGPTHEELAERAAGGVESAPAPGSTAPAAAEDGPVEGGTAEGGTAAGGAAGGDDGKPSYVTPLVRKLAAEHGVDLAAVQGTGMGGRIRKQDVLDAAKGGAAAGTAGASAASAGGAAGGAAASAGAGSGRATSATGAASGAAGGARAAAPAGRAGQPTTSGSVAAASTAHLRGRTEKLSRLRTVIAQRMVESLQVSAQLTTVVEVDVTRIARLREQAKATFEAREGTKLSFLPFFAVAAIEALKEFPVVNSSIDLQAGTVTYHEAVHLGIAVDTERGLLVPVIQDAGDLNLGGIARKVADLAERTRSNRVTPDELGGGTFTLTNTGSRGALFDTPIINQPQVAILGTGSVVKRPVVVDDPDLGEVVAVRSMVYLALSYDHRIVDGADAARYLAAVKDRLEEGSFEAELGLDG
ncbi:MAG TPA: 2-oxo acid dehydrogenase subunit E2 [Mycobacteriales bacterium]|jgi:2-oxoglutarate dehydrogenase E2 component (dihydrolipoamide succinyltransferase)|nr:2-oxo acid dehydrogenase subunit E2 [Mycobacteriales bacterium]